MCEDFVINQFYFSLFSEASLKYALYFINISLYCYKTYYMYFQSVTQWCVLIVQICRRHKNSEATAYLLEKAGDIQGAFGIILTVTFFFLLLMCSSNFFLLLKSKILLKLFFLCCLLLCSFLGTWCVDKNVLLHVLYIRVI